MGKTCFMCVAVFAVSVWGGSMVRADGAVSFGVTVGSIHRIGALAQGLEACNGWAFWHIAVEGKLVSIDVLRQQLRAKLN